MGQNTTPKPRILYYQCRNYIYTLILKKDGAKMTTFQYLSTFRDHFPIYLTIHSLCRWFYFFLKNKNSIRQLMETFPIFYQCSCLKPNYEKCGIAVIWVLKSVKMAVYAVKCVDLCTYTIRIAGVHFSYNKTK